MILEGIVGANGVFVPPPGYWAKVRAICDRHGVLLISDEVLSGFGRTGRWFAVDHDGVTPDLMTMAKGLTAGYAPGGAVIVTERIARHFDENVLQCGLTAYAHPLTCAAIVAAVETLRDEGLPARAAELGGWLGGELAALAAHAPAGRRGAGDRAAVGARAGGAGHARAARRAGRRARGRRRSSAGTCTLTVATTWSMSRHRWSRHEDDLAEALGAPGGGARRGRQPGRRERLPMNATTTARSMRPSRAPSAIC